MASRVKITKRDRGYNALTKRIYGFGKVHLKVGVFSDDPKEVRDKDGRIVQTSVTVRMVAEWMEFGTATVPARSFIRGWFDENKPYCQVQIASALRAVVRGAITKEKALSMLGERFAGGIKARMAAGIPPELKYREGTPLIDTGQLRSSVTFEVVL